MGGIEGGGIGMINIYKLIPYILSMLIVIGLIWFLIYEIRSCHKEETISEGQVIMKDKNWAFVKPRVVNEINENILPSDKASDEIKRLRKQVEWYASYTAQLEEQIMEGGATIIEQGNDVELDFEGVKDWGYYEGACGIKSGVGWHKLDLQFSPIPLRVYKLKNGTIHIISPVKWVNIGDVEVVEEMASEPWYKNVHLSIGGGYSTEKSPIESIELGINKINIEYSRSMRLHNFIIKYNLF